MRVGTVFCSQMFIFAWRLLARRDPAALQARAFSSHETDGRAVRTYAWLSG
jgi:hypothetical protein